MSRLAERAAETLDATEVAEMKQHLAFLRRYKDILRLKLNAAEDLLVNGQREPTERGVCRHLLGKVDRAVIDAAIAREPLHSDAAGRIRMLAGAVRLTADVGVLLAYLEALAHARSRAEAAQAFAEVVARIDFAGLSATRLARLLQVLIETFVDHERVQVLFSLLAMPSFRAAFDAAVSAFPPDVTAICAPLRAVHGRTVGHETTAVPATMLATGLEQVLSAPDPILRAYSEPLRIALLELALDADVPPPLADRATGVLLPTLTHAGRTYSRLALRRASELLGRHADDRARVVLDELRRAQPGLRAAERWLAALGGRRLGRIALEGDLPTRGRLATALWLDAQRPVWVRTAAATEAARLAAEAQLQAALALPGVAPVVESGTASGIPYVAMSAAGRPLLLDGTSFDVPAAFALATTVARILRALALAGIVLPDAEPERFLHASPAAVTLADLDGAGQADPATAAAAHAPLARRFAAWVLGAAGARDVATDIETSTGADLVRVIAALDQAALRTRRT